MKYVLAIVLMLCFLSTQAQVQSASFNLMLKTLLSHNVPEVTVADVVKMDSVLFLDAREIAEFNVSHLEGAISVGYDRFNENVVATLNKNKKIVVYCSVGYRSEKITEKLKKSGFTDVSNLVGGIFEWINQDNIVVDNSGNATKNVHAYNRTWGVWLTKGNKHYK